MSLDAISWAFQQDIKPATAKFVLVAMADRAGEDHTCFPSIDRLVLDTSLNRKTVLSSLKFLVEMGFIEDTDRRVGQTNSVIVYRLIGVVSRHKRSSPRNGTTEQSQKRSSPRNGTTEQSQKRSSPRNGTTEQSQKRSSPRNGTTEQSQKRSSPRNGTTEQSQKRKRAVPKTVLASSPKNGTQNQPDLNQPRNHNPPLPPLDPNYLFHGSPPDWFDPAAWQRYIEHRKKIRKPLSAMTERGIRSMLEKDIRGAIETTGLSMMELVDYNERKGYQGFFHPKGATDGRHPGGKLQRARDALRDFHQKCEALSQAQENE